MRKVIESMLNESAETIRSAGVVLATEIQVLAEWIIETYRQGHKVVLFGNGGSMCDAMHIAGELVGRFRMERAALPALAFSDPGILTAVSNDYGYETVFARQVAAWVTAGDLVVGISTSGKSPSVVVGLQTARRHGARTVALTGERGSTMSEVADLVLAVPSSNTPRIQECHITIGHIVCELVEQRVEKIKGPYRLAVA
jgi:D-sedoheptulose 7-phosphate isomerase